MSKVFVFMNDTPPPAGLHENRREVFWPKSLGSRDYHEPSLRETFTSKSQMRRYLATHGLRDAGERVNPNKSIAGREKMRRDPVLQRKIQDYVKTQGGAGGLLDRIQRGNL